MRLSVGKGTEEFECRAEAERQRFPRDLVQLYCPQCAGRRKGKRFLPGFTGNEGHLRQTRRTRCRMFLEVWSEHASTAEHQQSCGQALLQSIWTHHRKL